MSSLPPIIQPDEPHEPQSLFQIGSTLDDESIHKLESRRRSNGARFKGKMLKSQDISIQKFYENLQHRASNGQSSSSNIPKPPKISLEVKKSIRHNSKSKRMSKSRGDRLDHNIYAPANSNEFREESKSEASTLLDDQKTFDIASGEITLQNEALSYTIHEVPAICISINFTVLFTGQLWTIFIPTNELVNELLRVCKLKSQHEALESFCAMLLSCTTLEISSFNSKITNGSFSSHLFQGYVLQALHVIVNNSAKKIQSFLKVFVERKQKLRALEKRRKARQSQMLAATRAKEKIEALKKQLKAAEGTGTYEGRKFSQRGSTFSKAVRLDEVSTSLHHTAPAVHESSVSSNTSSEVINNATAPLPPRRPSQRKPATYSQSVSRSARPSFRNIVTNANNNVLAPSYETDNGASNSLGIAATFNTATNAPNAAPTGNTYSYGSYSNNFANSLVNNLRDELSHTLTIFEDEIVSLKQELEEQKLSIFYSRGGAGGTARPNELMFAYTPLDQEVSSKSGANNAAGATGGTDEIKQRFRSNAFKEGSFLNPNLMPVKSTHNSAIIDALGNVEVATLKADFEALQKKFQSLEVTLQEQQESANIIEQKAREEIEATKETTEMMIQNAILTTKNEMMEKFQNQLVEKQNEIRLLQEKIASVDKAQNELIQKQVTDRYEELQKKLKDEYTEMLTKQEDLRNEMTTLIEARQIAQAQKANSNDGQANIRQSIVFDELDFPVQHHEETLNTLNDFTKGEGFRPVSPTLNSGGAKLTGKNDSERVTTRRVPRTVIKPNTMNDLRQSTIQRLDELSVGRNILPDAPYVPMDKFHQADSPSRPPPAVTNTPNNTAPPPSTPTQSKLNPFSRFYRMLFGGKTAAPTTSPGSPENDVDPVMAARKKQKVPAGEPDDLEDAGVKTPKERELDNNLPIHPTSARLQDLFLLSPASENSHTYSVDHGMDDSSSPRIVLQSYKESNRSPGARKKSKNIIRGGLRDNTGAIKLKKKPRAKSSFNSTTSEAMVDDPMGSPVSGGSEDEKDDHEDDIPEGEDEDHDDDLDSIQQPTESQKAKEAAAKAVDPELLKQDKAARDITRIIQYHHMLLSHVRNRSLTLLRITAIQKLFRFYCQSPSTTTTAQDMILSNALELIATSPAVPISHPLFALVVHQYTTLIEQYEHKEGLLYPIDLEMFLLSWEKSIPNEQFVEKGLSVIITIMKLKMRKFFAGDGRVIQKLLTCLQAIILHYQPLYPPANQPNLIFAEGAALYPPPSTSPSFSREKKKSIILNRSLLPFKVMKLLYKLIEMIYHKLYLPYVNHLSAESSTNTTTIAVTTHHPGHPHHATPQHDVKNYEKIFSTLYHHPLFALLIPLCFEHYARALPMQPPPAKNRKASAASTGGMTTSPASSPKHKNKYEAMEEEKKEIYQQSYEHILKTLTILLAMQSLTYLAREDEEEEVMPEQESIQQVWQGYHLIDYLLIHLFHHTYFTYPTLILSYHWTVQCLTNCLVSGEFRSFVTRGMFPAMLVKFFIVLQHSVHYHGLLPAKPSGSQSSRGSSGKREPTPVLPTGSVWEDNVPLTIQRHACQLIIPYINYCIQMVYEQPENSLVLQYTGIVDVLETMLQELHRLLFPTSLASTRSSAIPPIVSINNAMQSLRMSVFMHTLHLLSFLVLPAALDENGNPVSSDMASLVKMLGTNHMLPVEQLQQLQTQKLLAHQQKIMSILLGYFSYFSTILITTMDSNTVRDSTNAGNVVSSPYKEEMQEIMERVLALQHNYPVPMNPTTRMLLQPAIVTSANTSHSTKS